MAPSLTTFLLFFVKSTGIFLFALLMILRSGSVLATPVWFTSTIKTVYPQGNGDYVLIFNDPSPSCSHAGGYHLIAPSQNGMSEAGSNKMYALAVTAAALGKTLTINFDDSSSNCYVNRLLVDF